MTNWFNDFLGEATNLETLAVDCGYLQDENVVLIGELKKLPVRERFYAVGQIGRIERIGDRFRRERK